MQVTGGLGDVRWSMLDEVQFKEQNGDYWALADGRSIAGTPLSSLTGATTLPDMRGMFARTIGGSDTETTVIASVSVALNQIVVSAPTSSFALATGQKVSFTTSGTLPSPLAAGTVYYVIKVNSTTFKLANTYSNAINSSPLTLLSTGSGVSSAVLNRAAGSSQLDQMQGHRHDYLIDATGGGVGPQNTSANVPSYSTGIGVIGNPSNDGVNGTPRTGLETRPVNIGFYCYVRIS